MVITEIDTGSEEIISLQSKRKSSQHASLDREHEFEKLQPKVEGRTPSIEEEVVAELNQKHAVVDHDQFYILTEKENPFVGGKDFSLESKQSFKNKYENKIIHIPGKGERTKAEIWLKSPHRREYKGLVFDPRNKPDLKGYYNIWQGYAFNPKKGDCSKYWAHVYENICSGNETGYTYVRKWLAYVFQYPDELHTALVLQGSQGVGKNSFVEPLGVLLGLHYVLLSNISELVSNFNFHLKNAVLIHVNEALWGGHKKEIGTLKAMITEKNCTIEPKGKDRITVRNSKHLILSSNEEWPVHLDPDCRRFFVLKVSEAHKEDHAYFGAIQKQLNEGGYEALLYDLLNEDLSEFNPRLFPNSPDAFHIKIQSADSILKYLFEALKEGCFDVGNSSANGTWNNISTDSVFSDYSAWCSRNGMKPYEKNVFCRKIQKTIPSIILTRPGSGDRKRLYQVPSLAVARFEFQKAFKAGAGIWDD